MATVNWARISLLVLACWVGSAHGQDLKPSSFGPDQDGFCPGASRVSSGTMPGELISRPDPIFPPETAKAHVSGSVVLRVCVGTDGHVRNLVPISGPEMLRQSYIDAVSRWVYRPFLLNGIAVPVVRTITVNIQMGAPVAEKPFWGNALPGDPDYPVRVSSGTLSGLLIKRPDPVLPPEAIKAHVNGAVVMWACVGADGHVKNVAPISGPEMLRKSYMDAVSRWEYRPYLLNGIAVPVITVITISLNFGGG